MFSFWTFAEYIFLTIGIIAPYEFSDRIYDEKSI